MVLAAIRLVSGSYPTLPKVKALVSGRNPVSLSADSRLIHFELLTPTRNGPAGLVVLGKTSNGVTASSPPSSWSLDDLD